MLNCQSCVIATALLNMLIPKIFIKFPNIYVNEIHIMSYAKHTIPSKLLYQSHVWEWDCKVISVLRKLHINILLQNFLNQNNIVANW